LKKLLILFSLCFNTIFAQYDFFDIYNQISDSAQKVASITELHYKLMEKDSVLAKDTVSLKLVYKKQQQAYDQSILPLYKLLINKTFPDISFTDINYTSYNLSSFSNQHLILNYNYLYCLPCMNRIDSTLNLIKNKEIKLIVLLKDFYRKDLNELFQYGDKILVGFMTPETVDLLSLYSGDDKMYLLNPKRGIEYFDCIESENRHETWLKFLKTFNPNE